MPKGATGSGCATFARNGYVLCFNAQVKQGTGFLVGYRWAEQEALHFVALQGIQKIKLLLRLDTFRDDLQSHVMCHGYDGADDRRIIRVRGDVTDKGTVDLDGVDREALQMAQRRVAGTKVID